MSPVPVHIFVHIPKTAGTTLRTIALQQYPDGTACGIYDGSPIHLTMQEFKDLPANAKRAFRLVIGHFPFGAHTRLPPDVPYRYLTLLRSPSSRIISLYNHICANDPSRKNLSLKQFFVNRDAQFDNHQTRLLSGAHAPFGKCSRAMLDAAMANIEKEFELVGTTERFDDFYYVAARRLGWTRYAYVSRNLQARNQLKKDSVDAETNELIRRYNALDQELYDWVSKRFDDVFDACRARDKAFDSTSQALVPVDAPLEYAGCLGDVNSRRAVGWARRRQSDEWVRVRIVTATKEYTVVANHKRDDLRERGIHPRGACGFILRFPPSEMPMPGETVSAYFEGTETELANSPKKIPPMAAGVAPAGIAVNARGETDVLVKEVG